MDRSVMQSDFSAFFENIKDAFLTAIVIKESDSTVVSAKEESELFSKLLTKLQNAHTQISRVVEALDVKAEKEDLEKIFLKYTEALANVNRQKFLTATKWLAVLVKKASKKLMSLR